jgi:MFS family permease
MTVVAGSLGLGFNFQLPLAATELGAGANGYGTLVAAVGIGGLTAGLLAERLMGRLGQGRVILLGLAAVATGLVACGAGPSFAFAVAGIGLAGAGFAIYGATTLALLQALTPPALRGRTTALFSLLYWGLMPVGAVVGGFVASAVGARATLVVMGIAVALAGIAGFAIRRQIAGTRVTADGSVTRPEAAAS